MILGLWDQTGAFADVGPLNDRGMRMALEERGMKILGRPVKYMTRDGATQAGTSTRRAEEAIDGEGAKFMIGPWSSGVALAVSEVAKRKKVLHLFSGGTEDISGARCHRYSFQWAASPYTAAKTVVDNFMKANPKAKRWHLLVADYAFGWSVEKYIKEVGKTHGIEFVGADRHPLGEREFSNYVQKAAANKPDVVAMINFGGDAVAGAREIFNFGLTPKVPLIMSVVLGRRGADPALARDPREPLGRLQLLLHRRYAGGEGVREELPAPSSRQPARLRALGRLLDDAAAARRLRQGQVRRGAGRDQGARRHRGRTTSLGRMRVDAATHQTLRPYFFLRCKPKAAMKHELDFADIIATGDAPLPKEYAACKDIGGF